MKIEAVKVVQDALIGGHNVQHCFIYNNQFDSFEFECSLEDSKKGIAFEDAKFKAFLSKILKESK